MIIMEVWLENKSPNKLSIKVDTLPNASEKTANANSTATNSHKKVWLPPTPRLSSITPSMISFPTYKILTGMAERISLINAVAIVSEGLVFQTSLKKAGRLPNAEKRSLKLMSCKFCVGGLLLSILYFPKGIYFVLKAIKDKGNNFLALILFKQHLYLKF